MMLRQFIPPASLLFLLIMTGVVVSQSKSNFATIKQSLQVSFSVTATDLQVEMIPDSVIEGDEVNLNFQTTSSMTVTWYKNGTCLSSSSSSNLSPVSQSDTGCCTVTGQSYHSPAVTPNVHCPPKYVSVTISPSGEIVEGSSVTLTCSSDANPPVQSYTWYKGPTFIKTGPSYSINRISSEDSGEYSCKARNQYGEKYSDGVTLNILYPPKRVSVSISPSGEIVEGSSVTLTCSSDANPPVQSYTWYKGTTFIRIGPSHSIKRISSEDSGEYKCKARNQNGETCSDGAALNVLYPPKSVSVSISPSGEIAEGGSVTLTCSSDANPPVECNWYKGTVFKSKGKTYTIRKISSEDSGEYECKSSNQYGEKYSDETTVNVLYPPKRVSVSISPSGEIAEGSSVTLTCSSDANPPVQSYTWYKVNESSPVGSGQSYSFTLSSNSSGWFYCAAQNKYGTRSAAAVPLTLDEFPSFSRLMVLCAALGVGVCGLGTLIAAIFCLRRRKREKSKVIIHEYENGSIHSGQISYISLDPAARSSNDIYSTLAAIMPQ